MNTSLAAVTLLGRVVHSAAHLIVGYLLCARISQSCVDGGDCCHGHKGRRGKVFDKHSVVGCYGRVDLFAHTKPHYGDDGDRLTTFNKSIDHSRVSS